MTKTDKTEKLEPDVVKVEPEASETNTTAIAEATAEADAPEKPSVTYAGITYPLDADGDGWPMDASIAFAEILDSEVSVKGNMRALKHIGVFLAAVLGPAGWAQFRATKPRTDDMRGIFDAILAVLLGAPSGE